MSGRKFLLAAIVLSAVWVPAQADSTSHRRAAAEFYSVATVDDPKTVAKLITEMISQLQPGLAQHQETLQQFAEELISSEKYISARVDVYKDFLSEEELRTLTNLFRNPTYQKYLSLRVQIVRRNAAETIRLFQDELPELVRRINENAQPTGQADS